MTVTPQEEHIRYEIEKLRQQVLHLIDECEQLNREYEGEVIHSHTLSSLYRAECNLCI